MLWLRNYISKARTLVATGTPESLTYAALECRLALERVCYERLKITHDYISHDDIRRWQPRDVVNTLIQEVDSYIATSFVLSMSKDPVKVGEAVAKSEGREYIKLGEQVGFDPRKIGKLWNALSSFLHVRVPKGKEDEISSYGEVASLRRKIEETLIELEALSKGTLLSSGIGETVSFECACGNMNHRRAALLKEKQVVSCIDPNCPETWSAHFEDDEVFFKRKTIAVKCHSCGAEAIFPERSMLDMSHDKMVYFECRNCCEKNYIRWQLMQVKKVA